MSNPQALIIEDDQKLREVFSQALKAAGFETEVIEDGALALEYLATTTPEVVVLDLHLPKVSGNEILDYVLSLDHLADTRVIIATADPRMAERLRNKASLVLVKPVSFVQLRDLALRLRPQVVT